jgi:hypothetical protein
VGAHSRLRPVAEGVLFSPAGLAFDPVGTGVASKQRFALSVLVRNYFPAPASGCLNPNNLFTMKTIAFLLLFAAPMLAFGEPPTFGATPTVGESPTFGTDVQFGAQPPPTQYSQQQPCADQQQQIAEQPCEQQQLADQQAQQAEAQPQLDEQRERSHEDDNRTRNDHETRTHAPTISPPSLPFNQINLPRFNLPTVPSLNLPTPNTSPANPIQ